MALPGIPIGTLTPTRQSRTVRLTVALLLVTLALTSTVSYAQGGDRGAGNAADAPVEQPPPITLSAAEPGEQQFIAQVAIESAAQLAALQRLGYACDESVVCEIVGTEAQLSGLREAGFTLGLAGLVVEHGLDESSVSGSNHTRYLIDDGGSARSIINISGAPSGARVTRVKYTCNVQATGPLALVQDYHLAIGHFLVPAAYTIWNRSGGSTDGGYDDDAADDKDIYLSGRWINTHFDGQPVNVPWMLTATDHDVNVGLGYGHIDYWILWVYYCTAGPDAPALSAPSNNVHTCNTTPTFEWATVTGADGYQIQVANSSSFASPVIDTSLDAANYTPTTPMARQKWYWRVRAHNECGYGPWSSSWSFTIDSSPAVPVLQAPANGSHTCDTTPAFDWADAAGALQYRIQVDDSAGFSSPAINTIRTVSDYTPSTALAPDHYYWRVRGESACGQGAWSAVLNFYIDPGPGTPSGPSPADDANGVGLEADLDWTSVAGASTYDVYFGTSSTPPFVGNVRDSQYTLSRLSPGTRYYWKVVAKNSCAKTEGPVWSFTTEAEPCSRPDMPQGPSPADRATDVALSSDLDWASSAGASSYDVYFGTLLAPPFVANVSSSEHALPTLSADTRYYWKVVAKNRCGDTVGPLWSFTTEAEPCSRPERPQGPSPVDGATGVTLSSDLHWASSAGASSYDVYFGTSLAPPFVANVSSSEHALPPLSAYTRYYWKVVAKNRCGNIEGPLWEFATGGRPVIHRLFLPLIVK